MRLMFPLIFSLISAVVADEQSFKVQFGHMNPYDYGMYTVVNDAPALCTCGKTPAVVVFFYGKPSYYCIEHIEDMTIAMSLGQSLSKLAAQNYEQSVADEEQTDFPFFD